MLLGDLLLLNCLKFLVVSIHDVMVYDITNESCDPGSAEPMQGLHPYLLEFVREKLLDNEIPTPHNKQKAIDTLMERLQDYIDKIAVSFF